MNKAELIDRLLAEHQLNRDIGRVKRTDIEGFLDSLGSVVQQNLDESCEVTLPGIGKLAVSKRAARPGRNPKTGEGIEIPAARVPKFKAAKALREAVNNG